MSKYSILIPVYNNAKYIVDCLDSILSIPYDNYELVISDNNSNDGTYELLLKFKEKYPKIIKLFRTTETVPIHLNWNNVITKASGEWLLLLGADDAVTPFFFKIADKLTDIAEKNKLKIIKSNRIYYFWDQPSVRNLYNNSKIAFYISNTYEIKKTKEAFYKAVYGSDFVDMPQMYTSSFFHRELIDKIIKITNSNEIIRYASPDAYAGVLAACMESKYLYSDLPLGWVGTSSSSTGFKDGSTSKIKLPIAEYREMSTKTYSTINSTQLLVCKSYQLINDSSLNFRKLKKVNIPKMCASIVKTTSEDRKVYLNDLLKGLAITTKDIDRYSEETLFDKVLYKSKNIYKRIMNKVFCNHNPIVSYSYNEKYGELEQFNTYREINEFISNNQKIASIINSKTRRKF